MKSSNFDGKCELSPEKATTLREYGSTVQYSLVEKIQKFSSMYITLHTFCMAPMQLWHLATMHVFFFDF